MKTPLKQDRSFLVFAVLVNSTLALHDESRRPFCLSGSPGSSFLESFCLTSSSVHSIRASL